MKKRIVTIALVVALLATCFAGTYAFLTDTEAVKNTFTVGNVYITLTETGAVNGQNSYRLIPGSSYTKDPTITLDAGSENAYLAAVITVKLPNADLDLMKGKTMNLVHPTHENMLMVGGLLEGSEYVKSVTPKDHPLSGKNNMLVYGPAEYSIYQVPNSAENEWTIYMFFEGAKTAETAIKLFDTIKVPATWNNAEMDSVEGMTIEVTAYAVQAQGFADCYTAMTTAFSGAFPFA